MYSIEKDKSNNDKSNNIDINNITSETAISEVNNQAKNDIIEHNNASSTKDSFQLDFTDIQKDNLIKEISSIDVMNITPFEGFNKLYEIVKKARSI